MLYLIIILCLSLQFACGGGSNANSEPNDCAGELLETSGKTACVVAYIEGEEWDPCPEDLPEGHIHYDVFICADEMLDEDELDELRRLYRDAHPDAPINTARAVCEAELEGDSFEACGTLYHVLPPPSQTGWAVELQETGAPPYPFSHPRLTHGTDRAVATSLSLYGDGLLALDSNGDATAWWAPVGDHYNEFGDADIDVYAQLAGQTLILRTADGVSVLDWSSDVPVERDCLPVRHAISDVSEDWLSVATLGDAGSVVRVYDQELNEVMSADLAHETSPVLEENRLLALTANDEWTLWELAPDGANIVDTVDGSAFRDEFPQQAAGFAFGETADGIKAFDLFSDALEAKSATRDPERPCLNKIDGEELWFTFEWTEPPARLTDQASADAVECHLQSRVHDLRLPAREPGGARVVGEDGMVDLTTGLRDDAFAFSFASEHLAWLDDSIVAVHTSGSDYDIPIETWIQFYDEDEASFEPAEKVNLPGPFVDGASTSSGLWLLTESVGRDYGDPFPDATTHVLNKITAADRQLDSVALPADVGSVTVVASGDVAWVIGEHGRIIRVDGDGTAAQVAAIPTEVPLVPPYGETRGQVSAAAGGFGLLIVDQRGGMWWVPADASDLLQHDRACVEAVPLGGFEDPIVRVREPGGAAISSFYSIARLELQRSGSSFSSEITARLPARRSASIVRGSSDDTLLAITPGLPQITL